MKIINVLVTGVGGNIGQGVIKALKMSNIKLKIVGTDIIPLSAGFFRIDKSYIIPKANDNKFLNKIIQICNSENIDIIFVCPPIELPVFAANKNKIENETNAKVIINNENVVRVGTDKYETYKFLKENNFNYPETALPDDEKGINELINKCGFPLIIKPRKGRGSVGVFKIKNKDELYSLIKVVENPVIQEHLEPEDEEYTSEVLILDEGEILGHITMKRELQEGTTIRAIVDDYEEVSKEAKRVAKALKSYGPCNFQLRLTKRGPVIFEINPRFSGTTPIRAKFGFNVPETIIRKVIFKEDIQELKYKKGIALRYWNEIYIPRDYYENIKRDNFINNPDSEVDNSF